MYRSALRYAGEQQTATAAADPAEEHRELRSEWTGRELRESKSLLELSIGNPRPLAHEVALHGACERDRAPEADGAQAKEVAREFASGRTDVEFVRRVVLRRCHV